MTTVKLNPNHAVTKFMDNDQWAKIVALLLYRDGVTLSVISPATLERLAADKRRLNVAIRFDDKTGIELHLVDEETARKMARNEGGLPI